MCGIAGIYRRHHADPGDPSRLRVMTDAIVHRGPDDFGYLLLDSRDGRHQIGQAGFRDLPGDVCLGSRRLAILDLSRHGRQPMANESSDVYVVFNGEIFNYVELRGELAGKGHVFASRTDTEVIVHAYEEWGADCVTRFNGMWAFAIWDQRRRELFCSRDRFGIKPFYYYLDDAVFLFASEIKAILPAMKDRPAANYQVLGDYLTRNIVCHDNSTFFAGIERLAPAHTLVVSAGGVRTCRYWDYTTASQSYDERRPAETLRGLFDDAVSIRLRSDVPMGVALSGGIDSTAVLAAASRLQRPQAMKAFTAVFPGERFDELPHAQTASQHAGAELFTVDYQPTDLVGDIRRVIWHMDYPSPHSQVLPRWYLMGLASRHVKVILEGQGADEMLGGYLIRYFAPYLRDLLGWQDHWPASLGQAVRSCRALQREQGWRAWRRMAEQQLFHALSPRLRRRASRWQRALSPEFLDAYGTPTASPSPPLFPDRFTRALHGDHCRDVLPGLLKFGDAISMGHSIESRLPFLDHRLVEFIFRLPPSDKLDGAHTKGVLRQAQQGVIPESIRMRRDKVGFETPLSRWIAPRIDSEIRPILLSDRARGRGIFDSDRLAGLLSPQRARTPAGGFQVFRWLTVELWFQMFMDAPHG